MSEVPPDLVATPSQTVGPFFHLGLTTDAKLARVADHAVRGERLFLRVRVTDGEGSAVPDALLEIWQADADGRPASPPDDKSLVAFSGFGRLPTSDDGWCEFETVRPGRVPDGRGGLYASHINLCLFARGLLRHLHTRVYFAGDAALGEDAALALVPESRRHTLLAHRDRNHAERWVFEVRLQGEGETVFFDS